jgi:hypothetical protein
MRFIVEIDPSTTHVGIVYGPSSANEPDETSLSTNLDKWSSMDAAVRNDINTASSTVVSISESACIAAQTADRSVRCRCAIACFRIKNHGLSARRKRAYVARFLQSLD